MTTKKEKTTVTVLYADDGKANGISHTNISETIQDTPRIYDAAAGVESIILVRDKHGRI